MSLLAACMQEEARRPYGAITGDGSVVTNPGDPGTGSGTLNKLTPYSALDITNCYGIQGNCTRFDQVYAGDGANNLKTANIDKWVDFYADMGCKWVRGRYGLTSGGAVNGGTARLITRARLRGMQVMWTVIPEGAGTSSLPTDTTPSDTTQAVRSMAANAADVTLGIEGLNEPNHNRNGTTVHLDWATNNTYGAVPHQKAIWDEWSAQPSLSGAFIVGPSLQDNAADASYTQTSPSGGKFHYEQMRDAGVLNYQHKAGLHTYPGRGRPPLYNFASRVGRIDTAYGDAYPIVATEWGYTTAVANTTSGHAIASEAAAATYGPRALLEIFGAFEIPKRPMMFSRFEGLDDYDAGTKDVVESNFGLWRVGSSSTLASFDNTTWSAKPEVTKMKAIFDVLADPVGTNPYTPTQMGLTITRSTGAADVRTLVAQKKDGTIWLFYWRNAFVMDITTKETLTVAPVSFDVEDSTGRRTVSNADGEVRWTQVYR